MFRGSLNLTKKVDLYVVYGLTSSIRASSSFSYKNLPEESKQLIDKIIRVDHAGEFGANQIYKGQLAVLGKTNVAPVIQEMWDQEKSHLKEFERLIPKYRVRPTLLLPLWEVAGFALGKEAAMACTVAVEDVISEHYNNQLRDLLEKNPEKHTELLGIIKQFRDDEQEHHDTGLKYDAEKAVMYKPLTEIIKIGCKVAVLVAEKI